MPNNDYRSVVHTMLSSAYEGEFKLSETDFRNKLDSNPEYAKTVFSLMSSAFPSEFTLKESEFSSKIYGAQKASSTPTPDAPAAPVGQPAAPVYNGPGLQYKQYFKHMLPTKRESPLFQRVLSEYDPKNPNQGMITANMENLKKRFSSVTGINKDAEKTDEYVVVDAMIKEAQARYSSESEPLYNENKEALDEYSRLSAQANDIAKQLSLAAKQRDSFSNTNISTEDRKSIEAIKTQYDNILAQFKDKDKIFSRLEDEVKSQAEELKMAYQNGIPDVMLADYNQSIDEFNQRLSNEYDPVKKERDTLMERMKELDIAHQSIISKYPGLSDPKYVALNGTINALYSQYNQLVNKIEDYESQYGDVIQKISDNYKYIDDLEKFRKELYYTGTYDQESKKQKDSEFQTDGLGGAMQNPLVKFTVSTLARTANVALNNIKNVFSFATDLSTAGNDLVLNADPRNVALKSVTELLDFVSQDEKPSYAPTDLESPFSGQNILKYNKFEKWDDKTGEWHKTGAAIAQEGIAQIAQIFVAGGMTRALMVGAEAVSASRAISAISKVGVRGSKAELLGFAKTAGVSTGVMTAISLPNYYKEGLMKFGDNAFAKVYAVSMSAAEGLLETILPDANLVKNFSKSLNVADLYKIYKAEGKKGISAILKSKMIDIGKENIEEIGAQGMGALLERLGAHFDAEGTDGVNSVTDWDWSETAETASIVSISMGVLGAPGAYGAIKMNRPGAMPSPARSRAIFEMAKRYDIENPNNEVTLGLRSLAATGAVSQKEIQDIERHISAASVVMQKMGLDSLNVGQRTKEAIAVILADSQVESQRLAELANGVASEKILRNIEAIDSAAQSKIAEILSDPDFEQKSADQELAEAQENEKNLQEEIENNKREQIKLGANMPMATHAIGATVEYGGRIGTLELSDTNRVLFVDEETGKSEELPLDDHTMDSAMQAGVRIIEGVANGNIMDQLDIVLIDVPGSTVSGGRRKPYYVQVKSKDSKVADENALVFSQSKKSKNLHEVKDPALKAKIIAAYNKQAEDNALPGVVSQNKQAVEERVAEDPATRDVSYVQRAIASKSSTPKEADVARDELEKKRKSGVIAQDLRDGVVSYSDISKAYSAVGMPVVPLDIRMEFAEKEDEYDMPSEAPQGSATTDASTEQQQMGKQRRISVRGRSFVLPDTVSVLSSEKEMEKKRSYATKGSLLHSNLGMLLKVQRALNKLFGKGSVKYAIFWNEDDFNQFTSQVNPGNEGNAFYDRASNTIFLSSQTLLSQDKFHESIHPIVSAYFSTPDGEAKMKSFYQQIIDESTQDHVRWQNQTGTIRTQKDYIASAVKLWTSIRGVSMSKLAKVDPEAYDFLSMSISTYSHAWMEFYMEIGKINGKPISFDEMINEGVTEYATMVVSMAASGSNTNKSIKRLFSLADMVMSKVGFSKKANTMPTSPASVNDIIRAGSLKAFASGIADAFTTQEVREGRSLELRLPETGSDILLSMRNAWNIAFDQRVAEMRLKVAEDNTKNPISVSFAARRILPAELYKQNEWLYKLADRIGVKGIFDNQKLSDLGATGAYSMAMRRIVVGRNTVVNGWADAISTLNHEIIHSLLDPKNNLVTDKQRDILRGSITRMYLRTYDTLHRDMLEAKEDEDLTWSLSRVKRILDLYSPAENKQAWNDYEWEEFVTYAFTDPVFNSYLSSVKAVSEGASKSKEGQYVFGRMRDEMAEVFGKDIEVPTVIDELATRLDTAIDETVASSDVIKKKDGKIVFSKRLNLSVLSDQEILEAISKVPQSVKDNLLSSIKDRYYVHRHLPVEYDPNWPDTQYFATDVDYSRTFGKYKVSFLIEEKDVLNFEDYNNMFRSRPGSERYLIAASPDKSVNLFEIHSDNYAKGEITIPLLSYGRVMGKDAMEELKGKMDRYKVHMSNDLGSSSIAFAVKETSVLMDPNKWLLDFVKSGNLDLVFNTDAAEVFMVHAADSHFGNVDFSMRAWHGSPHRFDRFSTEKIGTGEGVQAFGWGLYFTDLESIARNYAKQLSALNSKILVNGKEQIMIPDHVLYIVKDILESNEGDIQKTIDEAKDRREGYAEYLDFAQSKRSYDKFDKAIKYLEKNKNKVKLVADRHLYNVSLHKGKTPDQYNWLEWDKPVSKDLFDKIAKQLELEDSTRKRGERIGTFNEFSAIWKDSENRYSAYKDWQNGEVYLRLANVFTPKDASLLLLRAGIDGIKYPAESISRGATSDTARGFNYVVFDENAVEIENRVDFSMRAWHGSPHRFDRFSMDHIGTGEGAQAFGWGLYFTDLEDIARNYAKKLGNNRLYVDDVDFVDKIRDAIKDSKGRYSNGIVDAYGVVMALSKNSGIEVSDYKSFKDYIESDEFYDSSHSVYHRRYINKFVGSVDGLYSYVGDLLEIAKKYKNKLKKNRHLYNVSLHKGKTPDQYTWLEWDKPMSDKALELFQKFNKEQGIKLSEPTEPVSKEDRMTSGQMYGWISDRIGQKAASLFLLENGIDGIRYPAESLARGATSDTARGFNYVVFDENAVEVENRVDFSMRFRELGKATRIFNVFAGQPTAMRTIHNNAYRLYSPQRWAEIEPRLDALSEADLINYIDSGDASSIQAFINDLSTNNAANGNMWVLANIELMNRYEQAGDEVAAATVYERLMVSATYFGQALAQYAKLKSSSSEFLTRRIVALIASYGRSITSAQRARLSSDIARMLSSQRAVSEYLVSQKSELDANGVSSFDVNRYNNLESARVAANKRLDETLSNLIPQSLWEALGINMRGNLLTLGSATIGLFTNLTNLLFGAFGARGVAARLLETTLSVTGIAKGQSTRTINPISAAAVLFYTSRRLFSYQNMRRYYEILASGNTFDGLARDKYDVSKSLRPMLAMSTGWRMMKDIADKDFSKFEASFKKQTERYDSVSWSANPTDNTIFISFSMGTKKVGEFTVDAGSYTDFVDNPNVISAIESGVRSGVLTGNVSESGTAFIPKGSKTEAGIKIVAGGALATVAATMLRAIQISDTPMREAVSFGRMYEYGYILGLRGADLELFARAPHLWGQQMATQVETEASAVTFQEHSYLGDKLKSAMGGDTALGDDMKGNLLLRGSRRFLFSSIQPFISFPANFLSQSLEYMVWQYSAVKSMYYASKMNSATSVGERDMYRQKSIRSMATAMVGYGLKALATAIVNAGLITIPPDDDDRKQKATGLSVGDRKFNVSGLTRWLNDGGLSNIDSRAGEYQKGDEMWSIESLGILGMAVQVEVAGVANNIQYNTDAVTLGTSDAGKKLKEARDKGLDRKGNSDSFVDAMSANIYNSFDDAITLVSSAFEFGFMQGTANLLASLPKMEQGSRSFEVNKLIGSMTKAATSAILPGAGLAGQLNRYAIENRRYEAEMAGDDTFGLDVFSQKKAGATGSVLETMSSSAKALAAAYGMGTITPEMMINKEVFPATDMFGQPVNYSGKPKSLAFYMLNPTRSEMADFDEQELFLYSLQKSMTTTAGDPTTKAIPNLPISDMFISVKTSGGTTYKVAVGAKEWANFNKLAGAYIKERVYEILDEYSYKDIDPFKITRERSELIDKLDELYDTLGSGQNLAMNSGDEAIIEAWNQLEDSAIGRLDQNPELEEFTDEGKDGEQKDLKSSIIEAIKQ